MPVNMLIFCNKAKVGICWTSSSNKIMISCGAKVCLQNNSFEVLDLPPQSPDLNPIEHAWAEVKRVIADLPDECQNLIDLLQKAQNV